MNMIKKNMIFFLKFTLYDVFVTVTADKTYLLVIPGNEVELLTNVLP